MGWNTDDEKTKNDQTSPFRDASRGERLQRVMASGGIASRRKCEEMIEAGKVKVNGIRVDFLPAWVNPRIDKITVEDCSIKLHAEPVYLMYYKPRGIVCTMSDQKADLA